MIRCVGPGLLNLPDQEKKAANSGDASKQKKLQMKELFSFL
jgi:hypothetical protein